MWKHTKLVTQLAYIAHDTRPKHTHYCINTVEMMISPVSLHKFKYLLDSDWYLQFLIAFRSIIGGAGGILIVFPQ